MHHALESPKRTCLCELCNRLGPMIDKLRTAVSHSDELVAHLDFLVTQLYCSDEDRDYAECKANGTWPGWEWINDARFMAEYGFDFKAARDELEGKIFLKKI
jgi:hypothetical protein